MITISIVSPQKSMDLIDRAIAMKDFGCLFHKYVYDRLEEIEDIFTNSARIPATLCSSPGSWAIPTC